jgi:hypothetical protein
MGVTEGVPVLLAVGVFVGVIDRVEVVEGVDDEVSLGVAVWELVPVGVTELV